MSVAFIVEVFKIVETGTPSLVRLTPVDFVFESDTDFISFRNWNDLPQSLGNTPTHVKLVNQGSSS